MGAEDQGENRGGTRAFGTPDPLVRTRDPGAPTPQPAAATPAPNPAAGAGAPGVAPPTARTQMAMPVDEDVDPLLGQTLAGRYQIERKLGEGGMGSVYLGLHVALEKRVALKVLHGEFVRKPDLVQRFLQEAKAASKIRHDNVIDITDFGQTDDGLVFFAMEILDGQDLADELGQAKLTGEMFPWERTRYIFLQICAALSAAHGHGIIHRDLKPENIYLIERLGATDFVKLLDFGIAKLTDANDDGRKLTKTGMLFGTPEYMSPEQARGEKVDHRVDVYAMGCILFQMITGHVPFEADNFMGILTMHLTQETPLMGDSLAAVGAPAGLEAVVQKALTKDKDERHASIHELVADILALDDGLGDAIPRPRRASTHGDSSGAVAAPLRTQWTGSVKLDPGENAAVPAIDDRKGKTGMLIGVALVAAIAIGGGIFALTRGGDDAQSPEPTAETDPGTAPGIATDPSPTPIHTIAEQVTVVIKSRPRGATITNTATGDVVGRTPKTLKLDKSDDPILFIIERKRYRPYDLTITPNQNLIEEVKLERGSGRRKGDVKKDLPPDRSTEGKPPVEKDPVADVEKDPVKKDGDSQRDSTKKDTGLKSFDEAVQDSKKKPGATM